MVSFWLNKSRAFSPFLTSMTHRGRPSVQWMKFAWKLLMWTRQEKLVLVHSGSFETNSFHIFKYYIEPPLFTHTKELKKLQKFEKKNAFKVVSTLCIWNLLEYLCINRTDSNFPSNFAFMRPLPYLGVLIYFFSF